MDRRMSSFTLVLFVLIATVNGYLINDYNIQGVIKPGWEFVTDLFRENFVKDLDLGASVAGYHQGKLAFELWGGWFDESRTKPYDDTSLQLVFSTSKGLVAAALALAVQRGYLDYSAPVTRYWPEYGKNGKENTTVADILAHRAGLPNVTVPLEQYQNWSAVIQILQDQKPEWPPGSAQVYHPLTYGWLAGELIRRVDPKKRSIGQFIQQEIADPIILDFYIGLPSKLVDRVSPLAPNKELRDSLSDLDLNLMTFFNDVRSQQIEIPAANGIANVWSVARFYSSLIGDLNDGKYKRVINENTLKLATRPSPPSTITSSEAGRPSGYGMGFSLFENRFRNFGPGSFGHAGFGGSIGFAAPAKNFSFAYVMNRIRPEEDGVIDIRYRAILAKIAQVLNQ